MTKQYLIWPNCRERVDLSGVSRKSEKAFTLVELLCVITLIGMVVLIAAPVVTDQDKSRGVELAARSLAMDMRRSQQKAITTGWTQRIEFRRYNDDYIIRDGKTGERVTVSLPEGITYQSINFPEDSGYRLLSFNRKGAPNSGGTVALINRAGRVYYVIVTPATGRVRISEKPPDHW